jgi:hypothetical protein
VSIWPLDIVWTYARGNDRLHLKRARTECGVLLIETYPGAPRRSHFFANLRDLMTFQESLSRYIEEQGWSLVNFARDSAMRVKRSTSAAPGSPACLPFADGVTFTHPVLVPAAQSLPVQSSRRPRALIR